MEVVPEPPKASVEVAEALMADREQRRRLCAYARVKFGIDREDAEDVLQETAIDVMRAVGPILRPEGFVFKVFRAKCCGHLSRLPARRAVVALADAHGTVLAQAPDGLGSDEILALRQGLARISAKCRQLLRAHYIEGKSLRETGDEMSLAGSGVWNLINRCLRRLKQCLQP
jgi:RNA polymerase sigma factor (sigma-70 family)